MRQPYLPHYWIGSHPACFLCSQEPGVEPFHAHLTRVDEGFLLTPIGPKGALELRSRPSHPEASGTRTCSDFFCKGSTLHLGEKVISYESFLARVDAFCQGLKQNHSLRMSQGTLSIGRHPANTFVLQHPTIYPEHLQLTHRGRFLRAQRRHPKAILAINGMCADEADLSSGDEIQIGPYPFLVQRDALVHSAISAPVSVGVHHLSYKAHGKTLLDDLSFVVEPGQVCGILGLSGAGKSTLLKCLVGELETPSGSVTFNGHSLGELADWISQVIGYVPQEEIFHKNLTVRQSLHFALALRSGGQLGREECADALALLVQRLSMLKSNSEILDTPVSHLSGGQKRKLNLALELLENPHVLVLDEPLSGLSIADATSLMDVLRSLADSEGKTILLALHQPSLKIYKQLDRTLYLARGGKMVFFGPAWPDSFEFALSRRLTSDFQANPDAIMVALEEQSVDHWQEKLRLRNAETPCEPEQNELPLPRQAPIPLAGRGIFQLWTLLRRQAVLKLQDRLQSGLLLGQAPLIALLIGLVFPAGDEENVQSIASALYLMLLSGLWFGCTNSIRDVSGEWAIYLRERFGFLKLLSYLASKALVGFAIALVQCLLLVSIVRALCDLSLPWTFAMLQVWLASCLGVLIGLFISCLASPFRMRNEMALGLLPLALIPIFLMGGMIQPYKNMGRAGMWLASLLPTRWGYEALLQGEVLKRKETMEIIENARVVEREVGEVLRSLFFEEEQMKGVLTADLVMMGMMMLLAGLCLLILRSQDRRYGP